MKKLVAASLCLLVIKICFGQTPPVSDPCKEFVSSYAITQDVCNPLILHFKNLNNKALTITWDFGDGKTASGDSVDHTYSSYATYTVVMKVTYPGGCSGEVSKKIPVFLSKNEDLILTKDQLICPGQEVQLNTMTNQLAYCWLPADGLTDINNRNPVVKPTKTTTYRFQTRFIGENLVKNPGFEQGNVGFSSEYVAMPVTDKGEAQYWITTNPNAWHSGFDPCSDHTTGTGNLMIVNGSPDPNVVVWSQTVNVTPNTTYSFSLWISSVNKATPAKLRFQINGVVLNEEVNAGDIACQWIQISALWNSDNATTAVITIINDNTAISGNDYALDDISFSTNNVSYDEVTINVAPDIKLELTDDVAICAGSQVQLNASGASTYSWSPAAGLSNTSIADPLATPSATTKYIVTGTTADGCSGKDSVTVTVNPLPVIDIGSDVNICINNPVQIPGTVQGASTLSWSPATGLSDPAIANPVASPTTTTTYTLKATSPEKCEASKSVTISVTTSIDITTSPEVTICEGGTTQLTASGATKYLWSPAKGLSDPTIADPVASPTETTTYTVTGTNDQGCVGTKTVTVTVNSQPYIQLGADAAYCIGGSYQVPGVATNATQVSWSPATGLSDATIANPVASPTATTTYIVTATNGQCSAQDTITINVAPALQINTIEDKTFCGDTTIELTTTAVPGAQYQWTPTTGLSDATVASPMATLKSGSVTYKVSVTSADGCTGSDEVTLTVMDQPTIQLGADAAYCIGGSYQVPGVATNATQVSWSPATGLSDATIANPVASPTATTTYIVTATNGQCSAQDTITINVASALQVSTIDDKTFCGDTTIELTTTAVPGAQYQWTPTTGLSDATVASPMATLKSGTVTYKVSVTSADGCTGSDEVTLTVMDQPTIQLGADAAYCIGGSYQVPGVATNATQVSWSPASGLSDATIANPVASPTATTTYIVTATNGQCSAQDTITINVASALQVSTINDKTFCGDTTIELTTTAVPGAKYQWTPTTGLSDATIANPVANVKAGSVVNYKVLVTSSDGCVGTDNLTLTAMKNPSVTAGADAAYCTGGSYQIPGVATNANQVSWSPATGLSDATIANPVASPTATTTYIVTATNGQCSAQDTITINVAASIQVTPINDTSVCAGNKVPLSGTVIQGATYSWSPSAGLSNTSIHNPWASPITTTNYILTVSTPDGCIGKDSVLVTVADNPVINMINDMTVCTGDKVTLQANSIGAKQYEWWPQQGLSDTRISKPVATVSNTITYNVRVTNTSGCVSTDSVKVSAAPLPVMTITKPNDIDCNNSDVQLAVTGAANYSWSPATGLNDPTSSKPIAKPGVTTQYTVKGTTLEGCTSAATVIVEVKAIPDEDFNIPSAFTPNGDGRNDCFGLRTANLTSPFQFEVYNRWGQKIFASTNTGTCWDGTFKGVPQPGDAYVWQVKVKGECGDIYKKGTVVLVR